LTPGAGRRQAPYVRDSGLMMGEIASFGDPTEVTRIER
jgi:hypothetical protein